MKDLKYLILIFLIRFHEIKKKRKIYFFCIFSAFFKIISIFIKYLKFTYLFFFWMDLMKLNFFNKIEKILSFFNPYTYILFSN